ncbi:MAG: HNH endonuclease, partial [Pseudonocardia sp.]|nr:HNH endonuclease [Pseudonocardia sp.]
MAWFKVDDGLPEHRKVRRLGRDKAPAMGVWTLCGAWSASNLTDGFVPAEVVRRYDPQQKYAGKLVTAGLWIADEHDGEEGFRFHDWTDVQPTKDEVLAGRQYNARRTALHRDPELTAAVRERDRNRCRYCGIKVNWRDRRSSDGGTYDHVIPDGPNSLDNLVVACRGCNSRKGGRTPEQARMPLLPIGTLPEGPGPGAGVVVENQNGSGSGSNSVSKVSKSDLDTNKTPARPG